MQSKIYFNSKVSSTAVTYSSVDSKAFINIGIKTRLMHMLVLYKIIPKRNKAKQYMCVGLSKQKLNNEDKQMFYG